MKWIKASERLPEKNGHYFVKNAPIWGVWDLWEGKWYYHGDGDLFVKQLEWLDESESPSIPTSEEIERMVEAEKEKQYPDAAYYGGWADCWQYIKQSILPLLLADKKEVK